ATHVKPGNSSAVGVLDLLGMKTDAEGLLAIQRHTSGRFGLMDRVEIVLMPDGPRTDIHLTHSFGELTAERRREAHDFFADDGVTASRTCGNSSTTALALR
ncbi:MAG: hypothetical protein L0G54_15480, partial [Brevibacterium sp.]|nr:hypothetical protein [Brevibacterium sp.]